MSERPDIERKLGDVVWIGDATYQAIETECPDCLGKTKWHVTLPSGEAFDVECPRCYPGGFEASTGRVKEHYDIVRGARRVTINGVSSRGEGIEYGTTGGSGLRPHEVFDAESDALAYSEIKAREYWDWQHDQMTALAKKKGRPRKKPNGDREASGGSYSSANYARSQVRHAIDEAYRWIDYAARKGTVIDFDAMLKAREAQHG